MQVNAVAFSDSQNLVIGLIAKDNKHCNRTRRNHLKLSYKPSLTNRFHSAQGAVQVVRGKRHQQSYLHVKNKNVLGNIFP